MRAVCGRLQYCASRRPDVLYSLKELGRKLANPSQADWTLCKHLLRYLRGTLGIVMTHCVDKREPTDVVVVQSDTDWGGCRETRKSTCCGVIRWRGIILVCFSKTQSVVATSSPEAEYLGACTATAE
eukprot:6152332-Amphidinium_carterae.1